jgi:hypothetical protein
MAFESSQVYESGSTPQLPSDNTPNVPQQGVPAIQIPSPAPITPHPHIHAPSTRASASAGHPKPSKPSWLLSARPKGLAPSSFVGPELGINLRPTTRTDPARSCATETAQPAPHDPSSSVSVSSLMASCTPSEERTGKRKAEDEASSRDKEPRLASSAAKGRGGTMFINAEESSKIMRVLEEGRAAALVKNRRVTVAGGEARDADHPKRAKWAAAAAPSVDDDGVSFCSFCGSARVVRALYVAVIANWRSLLCSPIDTDTQLTWKRKMPVASSSVSGIKGKGVGATSAVCGVTGTPRTTVAAGNTNGPGLGAIEQDLPAGKSFLLESEHPFFRKTYPNPWLTPFSVSLIGTCDGTSRFSVPRGVALLGETVLPSQEIAEVDAEPTMTLCAWHDETAYETRPTTNARPMDWTPAPSLIEGTASSARPGLPAVSTPPSAQPFSEELANKRWPLSQPPWCSERKRALPKEEPLRDECGRFIGKDKSKAKACAFLPRNETFCVGNPEETSLSKSFSLTFKRVTIRICLILFSR